MYIELVVYYYKYLLSQDPVLLLVVWRCWCPKLKLFGFGEFDLMSLRLSLSSVLRVIE
jgi:hypothetical protein